jgi:hypothetical protein
MDIIKALNEDILNEEGNLRFLKGLLEVIEYLNEEAKNDLNNNESKLIEKYRIESKSINFNDILSICSLTVVSKIELSIILKHYAVSKYDWEKSYFLRVGVMNIYETINTYHKYTKSLKTMTDDKNDLPISFRELGKKLRAFKKENGFDNKMNNIRNSTIAHISLDFKKYYDDVKSIDKKETIIMIRKFIRILNEIYELSINCLIDKPMDKDLNTNEVYENLKNIFEKNIC